MSDLGCIFVTSHIKEEAWMAKLVGLSLSFCVMDILEGRVELEDVVKIVASTRCVKPEDWNSVFLLYKEYYWREDPDRGEQIARQLIEEGKIEQPRLEKDSKCTLIGDGHWIEEGEDVPLINTKEFW